MLDRYIDIKQKLLECARQVEEIKAIIAIGSSTREDVKADEYSDTENDLAELSRFIDTVKPLDDSIRFSIWISRLFIKRWLFSTL